MIVSFGKERTLKCTCNIYFWRLLQTNSYKENWVSYWGLYFTQRVASESPIKVTPGLTVYNIDSCSYPRITNRNSSYLYDKLLTKISTIKSKYNNLNNASQLV